MKASVIDRLHQRYFAYDQALKAKESWSKRTTKAPSFKKLIALQSKFELALRKHFKALSRNTDAMVNWAVYSIKNVKQGDDSGDDSSDGTVNIVVDLGTGAFLTEQQLLLTIMEQYILAGMSLGVADAQIAYVDAGLSASSASVQKAALEKSVKLVTGINQTTRGKIQQSIATSLKLGETISAAQDRLSNIIDDPYRAEMIARTETRNSYVDGQNQVATDTGAVSKTWDPSSDPCDLCQENADAGDISIDDDFPNGDDPHPNCLCGSPIYNYANGDESSSDDGE